MNYYQSSITKKIMAENFLKAIDQIYGEGRLMSLIEEGTLVQIKAPTVEECIYYGSNNVAILRYQELHETDWNESSKAVKKLRKKMFSVELSNKVEEDNNEIDVVEE